MWEAIIQTLSVQIGGDSKTVEVIAEVLEGRITAGMNVEIGLNKSMSFSVPIISVIETGQSKVKLVLDGEDNEGANMIEALNFADETLVVSSQ